MQVKALLLCTLFTLGACQTATPEPEPSSTSQVDAASGLVSYVLTYDQDISEAALQRKPELHSGHLRHNQSYRRRSRPDWSADTLRRPLVDCYNQNTKVSLDFATSTVKDVGSTDQRNGRAGNRRRSC